MNRPEDTASWGESGDYTLVEVGGVAHERVECAWCGAPVEVGESCSAVQGVYEGERFAAHFHPECQAASVEHFAGDASAEWPEPGSMVRGMTLLVEDACGVCGVVEAIEWCYSCDHMICGACGRGEPDEVGERYACRSCEAS